MDDLTEFFERGSGPYPKDIEEQMQRDWDEAVEEDARGTDKKQSTEVVTAKPGHTNVD